MGEQQQVDQSPVFTEVLDSVNLWIREHQLGSPGRTMAVVTDGSVTSKASNHIIFTVILVLGLQ